MVWSVKFGIFILFYVLSFVCFLYVLPIKEWFLFCMQRSCPVFKDVRWKTFSAWPSSWHCPLKTFVSRAMPVSCSSYKTASLCGLDSLSGVPAASATSSTFLANSTSLVAVSTSLLTASVLNLLASFLDGPSAWELGRLLPNYTVESFWWCCLD